MKKIYVTFILGVLAGVIHAQTPCVDGMAGAYPCKNMDLLSFVPLSDIGGGENTNDIWGWVSPASGKEYAIVGCSNGTAFVDVSNPLEPVYIGLLPTHTVNSLWRDMEVYNNYCFSVSEAANHGLQIFDLMELDGVSNPPVEFNETAYYGQFGHCHTINIDLQSGYAYCNGTNTFSGGLHIVNIQDPTNPTLAGGFSQDGYTHDCFAWTYDGPDPDYQGHEMVFACNEDELTIVDCTDKSDCQLIASYSYDNVGYVHQGWISKNKRYFLIDDELDEQELGNDGIPYGTRTHIFDCNNLDACQYMGFHESDSPSIDHNLYFVDQFVYQSNYRSGVRVLDAIKVEDAVLTEVGFFDLYPANDNAQFSGTWSNYPYLPSGINLATHMYQGFYILKPTMFVLSDDSFTSCGSEDITFNLTVNASELQFPLTVAVEGLSGVAVSAETITGTGTYTITISDIANLTPGSFTPNLALQTNFGQQYEIPFDLFYSGADVSAPALLDVPNNSVVSNTNTSTLFAWEDVSTASSYIFQLSAVSDFSVLTENQLTSLPSYVVGFNLPDGVYYWRVKSVNDCGESDWSAVFTFEVAIVNVEETATSRLRVYPNPVENTMTIVGAEQYEWIRITDLSGRVIREFSNSAHSRLLEINVNDLAAGSYLLVSPFGATPWVKQ